MIKTTFDYYVASLTGPTKVLWLNVTSHAGSDVVLKLQSTEYKQRHRFSHAKYLETGNEAES